MSTSTLAMEPSADKLLTASEAADLLSVPESWVREQTRLGLVPHIRLGRYVRYRRSAVLSWLDHQELGGPGAIRRRTTRGR